jgi:hypothetical protein
MAVAAQGLGRIASWNALLHSPPVIIEFRMGKFINYTSIEEVIPLHSVLRDGT